MDQPDRAQQRISWVSQYLGDAVFDLSQASEDASFRSYWRVSTTDQSLILMDAPPANEDCRPFIEVTERLLGAAVNVPRIHAQNLKLGFLLLDDLGEIQFSEILDQNSVATLYQDALTALDKMQTISPAGLPNYDRQLLRMEMALFSDWLLNRHLQLQPGPRFDQQWQRLQQTLIDNALEQPRVFVHRDYHCRNLMLCRGNNPGIIDYQDAVAGPITYDLVSLLRDCYISWPAEQVYEWAEAYRVQVHAAGRSDAPAQTWRRWFDLMGLQRQLKASGIFCRLWHRDGKVGFLKEIPRTLGYARYVAAKYPEFSWFRSLVDQVLARLEDVNL